MSLEMFKKIDSTLIEDLTFDQIRGLVGDILARNPHSGRFWDVLTCMRGPDSPSERPDMSSKEAAKAYAGRRERKFRTVEVIRKKAWFGVCGGGARNHDGDKVTLPPSSTWDHFDKHVARAAHAIGLDVEIEK